MPDDSRVGARPTLYVLRECLAEPSDWGSVDQYRAIKENRFPDAGPLTDLDHPVVRAGSWLTEQASAGDGLKVHLHALAAKLPSTWRELRPGQWRGLVTQPHAPGPWWVLFAGREREGDRSDVYARLKALSIAELNALYPSEDDFELAGLEAGEAAQRAWLQSCADVILSSLGSALTNQNVVEASLPVHPAHTGAHFQLSFEVVRLGSQDPPQVTPADICLSIQTKNWLDSTLRMAVLKLMVGLIDPVAEHWTPISDSGLETSYLVETTEVRLLQLKAATSLQDESIRRSYLETFEQPRMAYAHYTAGRRLTDAYIFGDICESICGRIFVPTQDASQLPVCPECSEVYETFV